MTAQRKKLKKDKEKPLKNLDVFRWTSQRRRAAFLLSVGDKTNEEIANEVKVSVQALWNWRQYPDFINEVEQLTIKNENFTRSALLKNCLKGMRRKEHYIDEDKSTYLDYIKEIAELQGYVKQKVDIDNKHSGKVEIVLKVEDFGDDDES